MTALPSLRPRTPEPADQAVNDFQSETAEITGAPDPIGARLLVYLLAGMVVVAILLASVLKLERVVTANSRVVSDQPTLVVSPLETSIVRSINVHENQVVHKGESLATLDPTFTTAEVGDLRVQVAQLRAEIARLEAEQSGQPYRPASAGDPVVALQLSIWHSRQAEFEFKMVNYKQKIESAEATIARARENVAHYQSRLGVATQMESFRSELEGMNLGNRANTLNAKDVRVEMERNLAQEQNTIQSTTHDLDALRAERDGYAQQWKSEISTTLVDRRSAYEKANGDLTKAERRQDMVELRAAEDAVVLELAKFSRGSVVQPAEKLMTLVPIGSGLSIEAEIAAADQGFVVAGQPVSLKFAAYRYMDHGVGLGRVRSISADSFAVTDAKTNSSPERYYRAMIEVTGLPLRNVPKDFTLVPGMTLTANIVVSKRTIMAYLLDGAIRNFSEGMREP